jgi:hypothetical protein
MIKSLLLSIAIAFFSSNASLAASNLFYLGFDKQIRDLRFTGGAQNLFDTEDMPQNNVSVGFTIMPSLSIECSYFQSPTTESYKMLNQGDAYFGGVFGFASQRLNTQSVSLDLVNSIRTYNTSKIHGFKLGLKETLPLGSSFRLSATVSLSRTTMRLSHTIIRYYTADETGTPNQNNQLDFSSTKMIPSVGVGIDYIIMPHLVLQANMLWDQTAKFNNIRPEQTNVRPGQSIVDAENSKVYSVGLVYQF